MSLTIRSQYEKRGFAQAKLHGLVAGFRRSRHEWIPDSRRLDAIESRGKEVAGMTDAKIRETAQRMKQSVMGGRLKREELVEIGFALVREASRRTSGLYHYPEQILAGLALVRGSVAEMATGEGKTLAITLPSFVFALEGLGVHVATVNSYLAERDFEFAQPIFKFLGFSVGFLEDRGQPDSKRAAYRKTSPMAPATNSVSTTSAIS